MRVWARKRVKNASKVLNNLRLLARAKDFDPESGPAFLGAHVRFKPVPWGLRKVRARKYLCTVCSRRLYVFSPTRSRFFVRFRYADG